ncbi:MAG: peptidylprolyl isomerase [Paracoccaceae bacterium]
MRELRTMLRRLRAPRRPGPGLAGLGLCAVLLCGLAAPVLGQQSAFSPAITVNGMVISHFELDQRATLFALLQPGIDAASEARQALIDDRLRQQAAKALGIEVTADAIMAGMETFAARANLPAAEFTAAIGARGVAPETFRDFISAGLVWREVFRQEYLALTPVSEREIDRAIAGGLAAGGEPSLLLSEIVIPLSGTSDAALLAGRIKRFSSAPVAFSAAARVHSKSPSAAQGGALDWTPLSALPPEIAAAVGGLEIGQTSELVMQPESVVLLLLRDRSSTGPDQPLAPETAARGAMVVDFVRLPLSGQTDPATLRAGVDRCEDLLGLARGLPEETDLRQSLPERALDPATRAALAGLDAGESALVADGTGGQSLVMLCARKPAVELEASRQDVRARLLNQKMALRAQNHLEALRAQAHVTEP